MSPSGLQTDQVFKYYREPESQKHGSQLLNLLGQARKDVQEKRVTSSVLTNTLTMLKTHGIRDFQREHGGPQAVQQGRSE